MTVLKPLGLHEQQSLSQAELVENVKRVSALASAIVREDESQPYIVYEKAGTFFFAAGTMGELVLRRDGFYLKTAQTTVFEPLEQKPLVQLNRLAARLLADARESARLYGWAAFEFSYLLQGLEAQLDNWPQDEALLYLCAPCHEAEIGADGIELKVRDASIVRQWQAELQHIQHATEHLPVMVDEDHDETDFKQRAANAIQAIDGQRLSKVILSRHVPVHEEIDLVQSYECLRLNNTPARSFLFNLGGISSAGVSPQAVIELSASGAIRTQPLAGTCAMTGALEEDRLRREKMLADPKEIYEHALSVKLAQEEIARVSAPGTVCVENFMQVVPRGSVQHMASSVCGQMAHGVCCFDVFASVFPAVTSSGIPKREACAVIAAQDTMARGIYSGAVLMLERDGGLDAALVLRSVYQKNGRTWLRAGAGLIAQSTPEREFEETSEKLRSVSRFLVPLSAQQAEKTERKSA